MYSLTLRTYIMRTMRKQSYLVSFLWMLLLLTLHTETAQGGVVREFTKEHPLIYEDVVDLWPYSFLNEQGQPDGFNIDLLRLIMDELNIPYKIRLKPRAEALRNLRDGRSDLTMALSTVGDETFGKFSKTALTIFTQSVVSPQGRQDEIHSFRDLSSHKVTTFRGSLVNHLMTEYGWEDSLVVSNDVKEALRDLSKTQDGFIVWNTLSLKWLLRKLQITNLELTPVDMPHGEYRYMSNNDQLLRKVDSVYVQLSTDEKLASIQNKWFYPDRDISVTPSWVYYASAFMGVLALLLLYFYINYRIQLRRMNGHLSLRNNQLLLVLETCNVRMWTYEVATKQFTWRNEKGQTVLVSTPKELAPHFRPDDFKLLMDSLRQLSNRKMLEKTIEMLDCNLDENSTQSRDYAVSMAVLRRNDIGVPTAIMGTMRDITEEHLRRRVEERIRLRYQSVFNMPMRDILFYNSDGILTAINDRACETFCCRREEVLAEQLTFHDILGLEDLDINDADGYYTTQFMDFDHLPEGQRVVKSFHRTGKFYYETMLKLVHDDQHRLIGMFSVSRDITETVNEANRQKETMARTEAATHALTEYVNNINYLLRMGGLRMVTYSPDSHVLTIYSSMDEVQLALTQTRCMTLVADRSKNKAMRMLNNMDNRTTSYIDVDILTVVRTPNGKPLHVQFNFFPITDDDGVVTGYFGLCRDVSELKFTEQQLALETARAQEVESTKNSFLRNMSYEIRTPLNAVVGFAEQFESAHGSADEQVFIEEILRNSDRLLKLINGILFLSRLDAKMIDIVNEPSDLAKNFEAYCQSGWDQYRSRDVRYIVDSPYESLVVNISAVNLGRVIEQIAANAAQHTKSGTIRARYDYIGRSLRIVIDDTGDGIAAADMPHIFERFVSGKPGSSGLGLPISKELIEQMGGTLEVSSEVGQGTTVWITLPCQATVIQRKKYI